MVFDLHICSDQELQYTTGYKLYYIPLIVELYILFPWIYRFMDKRWFLLLSFSVSTSVIIYTYYFIDVTPDMWFWNKKNLLILFILGLNLKNRLIIGTIEYISKRTYSIYLCHALVLFLCIKNITNFYSANSLHFELVAYLITFFGALLITELKKFL